MRLKLWLFGFDNYWCVWGSPLIYSSNCRPGYLPSSVPQMLAVSPGHVLMAHLLSGQLPPSLAPFCLFSTCHPKPGNWKPAYLYSLQ